MDDQRRRSISIHPVSCQSCQCGAPVQHRLEAKDAWLRSRRDGIDTGRCRKELSLIRRQTPRLGPRPTIPGELRLLEATKTRC